MSDWKSKQLVVLVIAILLSLGIGVGAGTRISSLQTNPSQPMALSDSLEVFQTASASVQGKIIEVANGTVTIENNRGLSGKFKAGDPLSIFTLKPGTKEATSSGVLDPAIFNKPVMISLNYQNGHFEIVSISVIPEGKLATPRPSSSPLKK